VAATLLLDTYLARLAASALSDGEEAREGAAAADAERRRPCD
jgi:hypothetical protein